MARGAGLWGEICPIALLTHGEVPWFRFPSNLRLSFNVGYTGRECLFLARGRSIPSPWCGENRTLEPTTASPCLPVPKSRSHASCGLGRYCPTVYSLRLMDRMRPSWWQAAPHTLYRIHTGTTGIASDHHYITGRVAWTDGWLKGGTGDFETVDFNRVKPAIFEDILVPRNQVVIFDIGLEAQYKIQNGAVHYVFTGPGRPTALRPQAFAPAPLSETTRPI
jgi:hypothetical protein